MKKKYYIIVLVVGILILLSSLSYKEEVRFNKMTKVEITDNPFNFGEITKKDTIKHTFFIKNISKTLLVITRALPSCTCTLTSFDKKVVRFGESAKISVQYVPKSTHKGFVSSTVIVECNAEDGVVKLILKGKVKE